LWTNFWRHKRTSWKSSSFGGAPHLYQAWNTSKSCRTPTN
jgi:hypothetical protein